MDRFETDNMDEAWAAYYEELDPHKRLKLLDLLPDSPKGALKNCQALYQQRYTDPKHPDREADTWLWKFVYLPGLFKRWKFMPGALKKEMQGTLADLCLERPEGLSNLKKRLLYLEFRNAARRYLSTCKSPGYASRFLGMKKATDQEKLAKACEDIWIVSKGIARAAQLEENLKLWCDALYDELLAYDPASGKYYEKLES